MSFFSCFTNAIYCISYEGVYWRDVLFTKYIQVEPAWISRKKILAHGHVAEKRIPIMPRASRKLYESLLFKEKKYSAICIWPSLFLSGARRLPRPADVQLWTDWRRIKHSVKYLLLSRTLPWRFTPTVLVIFLIEAESMGESKTVTRTWGIVEIFQLVYLFKGQLGQLLSLWRISSNFLLYLWGNLGHVKHELRILQITPSCFIYLYLFIYFCWCSNFNSSFFFHIFDYIAVMLRAEV